ncbi:hypothetical protein PPNSA23_28710 [Phyllobacterium phragmitis]|uniref:Uncharacterized protein n=1 Tax=Phyllobacterium phragmitis TaxID=2670329 RepID=A0ABQ0H204_9HYPH
MGRGSGAPAVAKAAGGVWIGPVCFDTLMCRFFDNRIWKKEKRGRQSSRELRKELERDFGGHVLREIYRAGLMKVGSAGV